MSANPCPVAGPGTARRRSGSSAASCTRDTSDGSHGSESTTPPVSLYNASRPAGLDRGPRTGAGAASATPRCADPSLGPCWSNDWIAGRHPLTAVGADRIWSRPSIGYSGRQVSAPSPCPRRTERLPRCGPPKPRPTTRAKRSSTSRDSTLAAPLARTPERVTYDAGWRATSSKTPLGLRRVRHGARKTSSRRRPMPSVT